MFQDPYRSLNPRRRVGDSIIEGLVNFGMPRDQAWVKAGELLRLVGLASDVMQRYPHQFSGGQRQRICIARALALAPDLLVADEAVSALDVSVQAQVLKLLEDIRVVTGIAVLFITHDLRVAAQVCDTIVVMQKGRVVEAGPAEMVLTAPRQEYTRALIDRFGRSGIRHACDATYESYDDLSADQKSQSRLVAARAHEKLESTISESRSTMRWRPPSKPRYRFAKPVSDRRRVRQSLTGQRRTFV